MSFLARNLKYRSLAFTGSNTSAEIDLTNETVMGIIIPASFTATTLKLKSAEQLGGLYVDVELVASDMTVTTFQWNVDGTNRSQYSFGGSFPPDVRYLKLEAGSSITSTVIIITKEV